MTDTPDESPLSAAMRRIMAPLARLAIARGLRFQEFGERLKEAYVAAAGAHFTPASKRLTDSRLSMLTGLQRKDIKAIRARLDEGEPPAPAGPLPRLIAQWRTQPEFGSCTEIWICAQTIRRMHPKFGACMKMLRFARVLRQNHVQGTSMTKTNGAYQSKRNSSNGTKETLAIRGFTKNTNAETRCIVFCLLFRQSYNCTLV